MRVVGPCMLCGEGGIVVDSGMVIFASDDCEDAVIDAREYIKRMKLTHDDVKLVKRDGQILVIAIKRLWDAE